MKKVNKNLVSMMIFIVLLSSFIFISNTVFANETEVIAEALDSPAGSGTAEDPYIISAGSSKASIKFKPKTMPFDFVVSTPGLYRVEYGSSGEYDGTIKFTFITNKSSEIKVCVNKSKLKNIDNWQLGIKTRARNNLSSMDPAYAIIETSSYTQGSVLDSYTHYYRKSDGTITNYSSSFEEYGERDNNGDGSIDGKDYIMYTPINIGAIGKNDSGAVFTRSMTLSNAIGESVGGYDIEENNLYYFTTNKRCRIIQSFGIWSRCEYNAIFRNGCFIIQ